MYIQYMHHIPCYALQFYTVIQHTTEHFKKNNNNKFSKNGKNIGSGISKIFKNEVSMMKEIVLAL